MHSIRRKGQDGAIYVSDLAKELHQPLPAISRSLRMMEQDGLIQREADPADRRKTLVRITPEGCAAILWKDRAFSEKAAEALHLTARDLKKLGLVDGVIKEPLGGAHKDYDKAAELLKKSLVETLDSLKGISPENLKKSRYERFRQIAFYHEPPGKKDTAGND